MPHAKADLTGKIIELPPVPKLEGRPSKMVPAVLQKLEHGFAMGLSDSEACLYAGIVPGTLYNYQKENPNFLKRKEQLKNNPVLRSKLTVTADLDKVSTAQWYLERRSPEFRKEETDGGTKQQVNFFISDEQLIGQIREYLEGITPGQMESGNQQTKPGTEDAIEFDDGGEISEPGER